MEDEQVGPRPGWPDPSEPGYLVVKVSWVLSPETGAPKGPWMEWDKDSRSYWAMQVSPTCFIMRCSPQFLEYAKGSMGWIGHTFEVLKEGDE